MENNYQNIFSAKKYEIENEKFKIYLDNIIEDKDYILFINADLFKMRSIITLKDDTNIELIETRRNYYNYSRLISVTLFFKKKGEWYFKNQITRYNLNHILKEEKDELRLKYYGSNYKYENKEVDKISTVNKDSIYSFFSKIIDLNASVSNAKDYIGNLFAPYKLNKTKNSIKYIFYNFEVFLGIHNLYKIVSLYRKKTGSKLSLNITLFDESLLDIAKKDDIIFYKNIATPKKINLEDYVFFKDKIDDDEILKMIASLFKLEQINLEINPDYKKEIIEKKRNSDEKKLIEKQKKERKEERRNKAYAKYSEILIPLHKKVNNYLEDRETNINLKIIDNQDYIKYFLENTKKYWDFQKELFKITINKIFLNDDEFIAEDDNEKIKEIKDKGEKLMAELGEIQEKWKIKKKIFDDIYEKMKNNQININNKIKFYEMASIDNTFNITDMPNLYENALIEI